MEKFLCYKCQKEKTYKHFTPRKGYGRGYSSWCRICTNSYHRKRYKEDSEVRKRIKSRAKEAQRRYVERQDPEEYREHRRKYQKEYRAKLRELADKGNRKARKQIERWQEEWRVSSRVRNKRLRHCTPPWADLEAIREFYKNCPPGYHVDHIVPINGTNICGLHVLENLQYLTAEENMKKSNKF